MAKKIFTALDLQLNKLQNVAAATAANEATNKGQVDTLIQEAKDYAAGLVEGLGEFVGYWDPANGLPTTGSGTAGSIDKNDWWRISANGTLLGADIHKDARLQASVSNPDTVTNDATNTDWYVMDNHSIENDRYVISAETLAGGVEKVITHNLGQKYVQVLITDTSDNVIDADIRLIDANTIGITANSNVSINGIVSL